MNTRAFPTIDVVTLATQVVFTRDRRLVVSADDVSTLIEYLGEHHRDVEGANEELFRRMPQLREFVPVSPMPRLESYTERTELLTRCEQEFGDTIML